jgi:predicted RNase H-like HicB family nuclease
MVLPTIIQFSIQKDETSGYTAAAFGYPIYTQGETFDEVVSNIKEAVECHFKEKKLV